MALHPPPPPPPPAQPPAVVAGIGLSRRARRANLKRVPKPKLLKKALISVQSGKERLELMSLTIEEPWHQSSQEKSVLN